MVAPRWKAPEGLRWEVVDPERARTRWDGWLAEFKDHHFRQCHRWGQWKSGSWEPLYTALFNGPTPLAMGLCLLKRAPLGAATVAWINGGPLFQKARPPAQDLAALKGYIEGLKEHLSGFPRATLRLLPQIPMHLEAQLLLRQAGFVRPLFPIGTSLTYVVDLRKGLDELREGLERNWRHQLKSAEKTAPEVAFGRDNSLLERLLPIHNELCRRKGLRAQMLTLKQLRAMAEALGEHMTFFVVSAQGQDGCAGAVWTFGSKGYFALSAANEWGREHYLPNIMYWKAIEHLKKAGFHSFDVTGIDPNEVWSVYNFKRGLNADPVEFLGEWDWSPSRWTRRAFNLGLWAMRDRFA